MEPLFEFLGNFWWLVFPLFGVLASVGGAWERGARRRHRRRLEVLHAKAELKAAQAAARGIGGYPVTGPITAPVGAVGVPAIHREPTVAASASQLERLFAEHDAVTARWLEYELDVAKLIAFPAMSDGRQPLTAAFLRAKKVADGRRPLSPKARLTKAQFAEYRDAVTDYEVAFEVAERDARRIKDSGFTDVERKRLDTAKQLLSVAIDQAATPAERQLAYKRVREELDGLISLSDEAIVVLETQVALELTTGPQAARPAATPASTGTGAPGSAEAGPEPMPLPASSPAPRQSWPVPSRTSDTAPGRVIHPKPHP
ncbi:hypothetical protein [Microbacterium sp. SS28]|uniref:hypothetical protein n=1 Tax=Microbacterium sp. SS28 TaxID=2919948 RepID=UPI001FA96A0A|nr:hypothetical protein [Microbacterium sp. SS28]